MKKIAVLGSRNWSDHQAVGLLIGTLFNEYGEFILVSGGGEPGTPNGVAEITAGEFGIPVLSFRPVKLSGDMEHEDSYGVDEWRLHRGKGKIVRHAEPTWADFASAAAYRSWMIADRCDEGHVFWDGRSAGASLEIDLLEERGKLVQVLK